MNKETIIDVITVFVVSAVVYKIGMEVSKNIAFAVAALTGVYFGIRSLRR